MRSNSPAQELSCDELVETAKEAGLLKVMNDLGFERETPWRHVQDTENTVRYVTTGTTRAEEYREGTYILLSSVAVKELIRICAAIDLPQMQHAGRQPIVTHATATFLDYGKSVIRKPQVENHNRRSAYYKILQVIMMRRPPTWVDLENKIEGYRRLKEIEKLLEAIQRKYFNRTPYDNERYMVLLKEWGEIYAGIWARHDRAWFAECDDIGFVADWMARRRSPNPAFHNDPYLGAMYCLAGKFEQGRAHFQGAVNLATRSDEEIYNSCMTDERKKRFKTKQQSEEFCRKYIGNYRESNKPRLRAATEFAKWFDVKLDS